MVIYGEYLFLENLITGVMILHLTRVFSGVEVTMPRLVCGGVLCGLYAFVIFVPMTVLPSLAFKLAFSFSVVFAVFGSREKKVLGKLVLLFYFVSFAMGGITIGLMYLFEVTGVSANGAVYMGSVGYLLVTMTAGAAYIMLSIVAGWMKGRLSENKTTSRVAVALDGKKTELLGLLDTGNFLSEPVTGKPVFLLSADSLKQLFSPEAETILRLKREPKEAISALAGSGFAHRLVLIPYRAVGTEDGMLLGIRPDYIEILKEGEKKMRKDVILGIYHGTFGSGETGEPYGILLHSAAAKGGLVCHG